MAQYRRPHHGAYPPRYAQIWADHTGWNVERQYGTSTKSWSFDTIGILTPLPPEARQDGFLTLNLTFDLPNAKARRRTPDNQDDFKPLTLKLHQGVWSAVDGENPAKPLSPDERGWLADPVNLFAVPSFAKERTVSPRGVSCVRITPSRNEVRDWFRKRGRIGDGNHARLSDRDRQLMRSRLNKLRDAGHIGIDGNHIWMA